MKTLCREVCYASLVGWALIDSKAKRSEAKPIDEVRV